MEATASVGDPMGDEMGVQTGDVVEGFDRDPNTDWKEDSTVDVKGSIYSSDDKEDYEESVTLETPSDVDEIVPMPASPDPLHPNASHLETVRHYHETLKYSIIKKSRELVTAIYHYSVAHNELQVLLECRCDWLSCVKRVVATQKRVAKLRNDLRELSSERNDLRIEVSALCPISELSCIRGNLIYRRRRSFGRSVKSWRWRMSLLRRQMLPGAAWLLGRLRWRRRRRRERLRKRLSWQGR